MPKNHKTPKGLKTFLSAIKSEIQDPKNRNNEKCNLSKEEVEAMKSLIQLQRDRVIIIKQCDKGAGVIIHNFKDYMKSAYEHLLSKTSEGESYYKRIADIELQVSKSIIKSVLTEGLEAQIITKEEFVAMNPDDKNPAKFYCISKIHKDHTPPETPPLRPIVSGSGSITENMGVYLEHHIKEIAASHKSYLQDTPHFLRQIEKINKGPRLPKNTILVTTDIIGAYQNIPQDDGIECLHQVLEERKIKDVPSKFLAQLMELIQKHNVFEFHDGMLWKQIVGTAMGGHSAPSYANIYLSKKIDEQILNISKLIEARGEGSLKIFKRFLDDIFKVFNGTTKQLHQFLEEMNKIHPTLKFTMNHTSVDDEAAEDKCSCSNQKSIPFLDTSLSLENGKIEVDLFRKATDRNQYLLPTSCHPKTTTKNLPYSCALRIVRICTSTQNRDSRLQELKELLLNRQYNENSVDRAIQKAKNIPRKYALKKVNKTEKPKRPIFAIKYDPRLPNIPNIQNKHWRSMVNNDAYLLKVFPQPPLTGFRKQGNLKNFLIKTKIPDAPKRYEQRKIKGMNNCGKQCPVCPFVSSRKEVQINEKETWKINRKLDCETFNCIYIIECRKCDSKYIGQTGRQFKYRIADHKGYVKNQVTSQPIGAHFNLPGHCLAHMQVTVLEQVKYRDETYRIEREKYFINKFNTFYNGLNREY